MDCSHPHCPMGQGLPSWRDVVASPEARIKLSDQNIYEHALASCGHLGAGAVASAALSSIVNTAQFKRLLALCPCLYAQLDIKVTARAVTHLCEVTLGASIQSSNVYDAFKIQHPTVGSSSFRFPPIRPGASGGDIMETLCSEVLTNHGVPHMKLDRHGWPEWQTKTHVSLNSGKMRALKLYGDILIPAAPHNILVSVKSEAARERFVVSGNRLESIGFGFFNDASEFWTTSRMNLLKRWGFSAIYLPSDTLAAISSHLVQKGTSSHAININGHPLFRPLMDFGEDIARFAGRLSINV